MLNVVKIEQGYLIHLITFYDPDDENYGNIYVEMWRLPEGNEAGL